MKVSKGNIRVTDIMTKDPLVMSASGTVGEADELMSENRIRQLPVVTGNTLVGIVTDRDIRSFLSDKTFYDFAARETALNTKVGEIMTTEPITLSADDELDEAVELLIEQKFGGIPVLDEAEGVVGVVTYIDVLRCFLDLLREE